MKSKLTFLLLTWLCVSLSFAQSVVINKVYNSGVTSPAGQDDVIELLVVEHQADLRGMILKDFQGGSASSTSFIEAGAVVFRNDPFWSAVPAGTMIVMRRLPSDANYVQDIDPSDKVLDLLIADSEYFDFQPLGGTFNVTNYDMLMLKTGTAAGLDNVVHAFALV